MESLLQFIYLGEVDVPGAELERLIVLSKELGIRGLDAVKKEEEAAVGERPPRLFGGQYDIRGYENKKRKSKNPLENSKRLKVDEVPIYGEQDPFDGQVEEYYPVAESDVLEDDEVDNNEKESQEVLMSQDGVQMSQDDVQKPHSVVQKSQDSDPMSQNDVPTSQDKFQQPLQPTKRGRPIGKRWSAIWDHFSISEVHPKYAICVHCKRNISRGSTDPSKQVRIHLSKFS